MLNYKLNFGIREPYQVIVDAGMLRETKRLNMDLVTNLERALHGVVKPMITQCSIRHLYNAEPKEEQLIILAKTFERRRCDHSITEEELSTLDCLSSVVDNRGNSTNKHHYIIASQDLSVRMHMRSIPGVPLLYVSHSIMFLEPMADTSEDQKKILEKQKLRSGLPKAVKSLKRAFDDMDVSEGKSNAHGPKNLETKAIEAIQATEKGSETKPPSKRHKARGPNPLSIKKPKKPKKKKKRLSPEQVVEMEQKLAAHRERVLLRASMPRPETAADRTRSKTSGGSTTTKQPSYDHLQQNRNPELQKSGSQHYQERRFQQAVAKVAGGFKRLDLDEPPREGVIKPLKKEQFESVRPPRELTIGEVIMQQERARSHTNAATIPGVYDFRPVGPTLLPENTSRTSQSAEESNRDLGKDQGSGSDSNTSMVVYNNPTNLNGYKRKRYRKHKSSAPEHSSAQSHEVEVPL
ncbi:MAG: hypothetical protein M1814_001498 [Vezdaea aestivalis]|nr:MAG: hypothetical protein M1814_001498 [Vezdaea aestivalis]